MKPYYCEDGITIYHGDCATTLPIVPDVDLVFTDPPYGIKAAAKEAFGNGVKRHMTGLVKGKCIPKRDYGDGHWDDKPCPKELLDFCLAKGKHQIIWGGALLCSRGHALLFGVG